MSQEKPINILIVDDNENNLLSLRSLIEKYFDDINVIEATSGLVALSKLLKEEIDFMLLDIQMPYMDGFETLKMIQKRQKTRNIPVVFMTAAYKSEEFQKKGLNLGAVDYLTKPINNDELRQKIQVYLRLIQQTRQQDKPQTIETGVTEIVSQAKQSFQQEISFERREIKSLSEKLESSLNTIINCNKMLMRENHQLGNHQLSSETNRISFESKELLDLVQKVLAAKLKATS